MQPWVQWHSSLLTGETNGYSDLKRVRKVSVVMHIGGGEVRSLQVLALCITLSGLCVGTALAQGEGNPTDSLLVTAQALFNPIPAEPPVIEGNEYSDAKELLGRNLFFDPRLSSSWFISCNSCHNVGTGGVDLQPRSIGHAWQRGGRNAPTVFNSVFNIAQFWDGRAQDLAEQAKGPVQASVEMNNTPEKVVETLKSIPAYVELFKKAFPGEQDAVTFDNMAKAIELFEATLNTPNAPFDRFLKGDGKVLAAAEREGLQLFMDKGCAGCHNGVNMGGASY